MGGAGLRSRRVPWSSQTPLPSLGPTCNRTGGHGETGPSIHSMFSVKGNAEEGEHQIGRGREDLDQGMGQSILQPVVHLHHNHQGEHFNNANYWLDLKATESEFLGIIIFYILSK